MIKTLTVEGLIKVKSVACCQDTSTLFTTGDQFLYPLVSGDSGEVATILEPLYIAIVLQDQVVCFNRQEQVLMDRFKAAVLNDKESLDIVHGHQWEADWL